MSIYFYCRAFSTWGVIIIMVQRVVDLNFNPFILNYFSVVVK